MAEGRSRLSPIRMKPSLKRVLKDWIPPAVLRGGRAAAYRLRPAPFEFDGFDWTGREEPEGWEAPGVSEARERSWLRFIDSLDSTAPMGVAREDLLHPWHLDLSDQALRTTFAYVLALAGRSRDRVRVLDWGGELGTYYRIALRLLPGMPLEWHCVDLPGVAKLGRRLNPDVTFHEDDAWTRDRYDLVFSSSSLQYLSDWRPTVKSLGSSAAEWLFVTRMPFVLRGPSFVARQRVPQYATEVRGWVINHDEFVDFVRSEGFDLVQSFVNHRGPYIRGAPEQNLYMGFLFRRAGRTTAAPRS